MGAQPLPAELKAGVRHEHVADGLDAGTGARWWLERVPGLIAPQLTISGSLPGGAAFRWSGELPGASVAGVRRKIVAVIAAELERQGTIAARQAARRARMTP